MAKQTAYENDPHWQAARRKFIDPGPGSSGERMIGSILAAFAMCEIERKHTAGGAPNGPEYEPELPVTAVTLPHSKNLEPEHEPAQTNWPTPLANCSEPVELRNAVSQLCAEPEQLALPLSA
jgi:hypothetical protein